MSRTEMLNNTNLQKQKLRENLYKLFMDDELATNEVYDVITESNEDILFFNSNFNKLYKELSDIIDLDYLESSYFLAFYDRYKMKFSNPKNIIVDEKLAKQDEEQYLNEIEIIKDKENKTDDEAKKLYNEDKEVITFLSKKPTYRKYGYFLGIMCSAYKLKDQYFLTNQSDVLNNPLINQYDAENYLSLLFSSLKLLISNKYDERKVLKYINKIQPLINTDISDFYDSSRQTRPNSDEEGYDNFIKYVIYTTEELIKEDYKAINKSYSDALQIENEKIKAIEASKIEAYNKMNKDEYDKYMKREKASELIKSVYKNKKNKEEMERIKQQQLLEQQRIQQEQQRIQQEQLLEQQRIQQEKQRIQQERLARKQQEEQKYEQKMNAAEQYIENNPHNFNDGDVITDGKYMYVVRDNNTADKLNSDGITKSKAGHLIYDYRKNRLGWYKGNVLVNVNLSSSSSTTATSSSNAKSQYPTNAIINVNSEDFIRYGDYLFRIEPSTNSLKYAPKYVIDSNDDIQTINGDEKKEAAKTYKDEIERYNAAINPSSTGAGMHKNMSIETLLNKLGYKIKI
jgi:hypothetical protein